jgi:hypothetical protein
MISWCCWGVAGMLLMLSQVVDEAALAMATFAANMCRFL